MILVCHVQSQLGGLNKKELKENISLNIFRVSNIILVSLKCVFEPDGKR